MGNFLFLTAVLGQHIMRSAFSSARRHKTDWTVEDIRIKTSKKNKSIPEYAMRNLYSDECDCFSFRNDLMFNHFNFDRECFKSSGYSYRY